MGFDWGHSGAWSIIFFAWMAILPIACEVQVERKEVYSVSGSLFVNGKPAVDAWITLAPEIDGVPAPMGRVSQDGSFHLVVYDDDLAKYPERGNPAGNYHVLVRLPKDPLIPLSPDRLGGVYADATTCQYEVTIEFGENDLDPIRIENAKLVD